MNTFTCICCAVTQPKTNFWADPKSAAGIRTTCRHCLKELRRQNARRILVAGFPPHQICSCCKIDKQSGDYHMNLASPTGLQPWCKTCSQAKYQRDKKQKLAASAIYKRARYLNDPEYRLRSKLSSALSIYVRGAFIGPHKSYRAIGRYLGIDETGFLAHLRAHMQEGMTDANYAAVWELDHIEKVADCDHTDPEQVARCWHYTNIRPEFKTANRARKPYRGPHEIST